MRRRFHVFQAFSCAVQLDAENSAAWTDLGGLYESQRQYKDALYCFKKAVQFNPGNYYSFCS